MAAKSTGVKIAGPLQESRRSAGTGIGSTNTQPTRQQYRILDETQRTRRNKQLVDQLERDNFHDDPHANLVMHKKAPKFNDGTVGASTGATGAATTTNVTTANTSAASNRRSHVHRSRILTYQQMVEEDARTQAPNYNSAAAPDPTGLNGVQTEDGKVLFIIPRRHFCSVCGFRAPYTCITCGYRYCSITCLGTHRDTRCLKWTV